MLTSTGEVVFQYLVSKKVDKQSAFIKVNHPTPIVREIILTPARSWPEEVYLTSDIYSIDSSKLASAVITLDV